MGVHLQCLQTDSQTRPSLLAPAHSDSGLFLMLVPPVPAGSAQQAPLMARTQPDPTVNGASCYLRVIAALPPSSLYELVPAAPPSRPNSNNPPYVLCPRHSPPTITRQSPTSFWRPSDVLVCGVHPGLRPQALPGCCRRSTAPFSAISLINRSDLPAFDSSRNDPPVPHGWQRDGWTLGFLALDARIPVLIPTLPLAPALLIVLSLTSARFRRAGLGG